MGCVESLEPRQFFSASLLVDGGDFVLGVSFGNPNADLFDTGSIGLPSRLNTLPGGNIGLPGPIVTLPPPVLGLQGGGGATSSGPARDLRGFYRGPADITGVGTTRMNLSITRQRPGTGTVTASVRFPRLGESFGGTVQVTFLGDRRFTFAFSKSGDSLTVNARQNRDGSIRGELTGQLDTRRIDGTFSVKPIAG